MIKDLINNLQSKRGSYIGDLTDKESLARSEGFKLGLEWAIDSAETILRNKKAEGDGLPNIN